MLDFSNMKKFSPAEHGENVGVGAPGLGTSQSANTTRADFLDGIGAEARQRLRVGADGQMPLTSTREEASGLTTFQPREASRGLDFSERRSPIDIPTRDAIASSPIEKLREQLDHAFVALSARVEPLIPWLRPIAFHGTSREGAELLHAGKDLRENKLWVGLVCDLPPTSALLTRDLVNAARVASSFSQRAEEPNGAFMIVTVPGERNLRLSNNHYRKSDDGDTYSLRTYMNQERTGAFADRAEIFKRFETRAELSQSIHGIIDWRKSPFAALERDVPDVGRRDKIMHEARALFVISEMVNSFENSPLKASEPLKSDDLARLARYQQSFLPNADGTLVQEQPTGRLVINRDRMDFFPNETAPSKSESFNDIASLTDFDDLMRLLNTK